MAQQTANREPRNTINKGNDEETANRQPPNNSNMGIIHSSQHTDNINMGIDGETANGKPQDTINKGSYGTNKQTMKVALYLRVSTLDQTTLNQELELKRYCELNNLEVYRIYKDEGVSGTKTSRPQLDLMLQDMRNKLFDVIVVWKFDRLGRSTSHLLQVLEELKNKNVRLIATSQNIDTNTPMGKFFFTILSGFAEMERELIRERIKLGLERRKKQGKSLGRPQGSKDKAYRKKSGYHLRWNK